MTEKKISKEHIQELILHFFRELVPFNNLLGIQVDSSTESSKASIKMKPEFIGNSAHNILHGGVIASILDIAGGLVAIMNTSEELENKDPNYIHKRLTTMSTIDMRIDYLLPGRGQDFIATARVIRRGSKIAVTRMELHNEKNEQIALGTATYLVG